MLSSALVFSCGSGSTEQPDLDFGSEEGIATLHGMLFYDGSRAGSEIVLGIVDTWPMTGPPKEFVRIPAPDGGFPAPYSMPLSHVGTYYVVAYLDVDSDDSAIFNADLDPMMMPRHEGDTYQIQEGLNPVDLVFVDAERVDWWW